MNALASLPMAGMAWLALALAPLTAQSQFSGAASGTNYFASSIEFGSGEDANTLLYRVRPTLGTGVVAQPDCQSATYVLQGGFSAMWRAPIPAAPWLTAVEPFFVGQFGGTPLVLRGSEMFLGSNPAVTIGGNAAAVGPRTVSTIQATLPAQPVPGFQPVVVTNNLGATVLNQGIGVLPLLELREPLNERTPMEIRYQGSQNDLMILALGFGITPSPFVLPGYGYSLQLEPAGIIFSSFYFVGSPDGQLKLKGPPIPFPGVFHVQALVLTNNPGYTPGSWTNAILL